ncbi:MAG: FUN14 domain-containing protein [Nitrososphaeraceae archaeon]
MAIDNIVVAANNFSPLLTTVGFGGVAGFLIGYAVKKIMKILAVGAGIFFTALMYLESQNIVNINWDKLQNASQNAVSTLASAAGQIPLASTTSSTTINFALPMTSSAAMGFAIGFMRG